MGVAGRRLRIQGVLGRHDRRVRRTGRQPEFGRQPTLAKRAGPQAFARYPTEGSGELATRSSWDKAPASSGLYRLVIAAPRKRTSASNATFEWDRDCGELGLVALRRLVGVRCQCGDVNEPCHA